ncbi:sensor histidine kinase [Actinoplanes rectilineatus]|uniref:sensor histidine kinase n=1 Tax=Actinoplanes rectilineatus TaxID=113571 RepID=UPI000697AAD7|nr:nitrate- and nitrite sensing domain-containing protein [Actinoplanes rectilineatus]
MNAATIRGRITRTLAPPLVAMIALLTVVAVGEIGDYRVAADTERRVTVVLALHELVRELQAERDATEGTLTGDLALQADLVPARERADARLDGVRSLLGGGTALEEQALDLLGELDDLEAVRDGVDAGTGERAATFAFYTEAIEELGDLFLDLETVADNRLRRAAESLEMINAANEALAQERVLLAGVLRDGRFRDDEFPRLAAVIAVRDLALGEFDEFASAAATQAKADLLDGAAARQSRDLEESALLAGGGERLRVDESAWWSSTGVVLDDMSGLSRRIGADAQTRAGELRARATLRVSVLGAIVLACLAGSAYLATASARSLAGPLSGLAREAHRLAADRLPEAVRRAASGDPSERPDPVPVADGASIEVHQVADALQRVQQTAYDLATEQAVLRRTTAESLADLGRRNQNLLRRQLGFITRLEQEESNPAGLANLFELDHLATRMRRNAESLLVLVGAASPRQWPGPLALTDVVRAAVSEVEEYRRVGLRRIDEAQVQGAAGSGLAHMLAELIENGLSFSPPDQQVEIHGRRVGDEYLIAICDEGVGMTEADMAVANERLRGDGDFLTAPARYLGHHVVGRLAAGMNVRVRLTPSPVTGVTARITLPAEILAGPAPVGDDPAAGRRALEDGHRRREVEVDYVVLAERPSVPAPRRPESEDGVRTRNGLRKRVPHAGRPRPAPAVAVPPGDQPVMVSSGPAEVRSRMLALRDGIQRGRDREPGRSQATPEEIS